MTKLAPVHRVPRLRRDARRRSPSRPRRRPSWELPAGVPQRDDPVPARVRADPRPPGRRGAAVRARHVRPGGARLLVVHVRVAHRRLGGARRGGLDRELTAYFAACSPRSTSRIDVAQVDDPRERRGREARFSLTAK